MPITFQYSIDDYVQAAKYHARTNLRKSKFIWIAAAIALVIFFLLPYCGYSFPKAIIMIGIVGGGGLAGGLTTYLIIPFSTKRQVNQNTKILLADVEIIQEEYEISLSSESGTSHIKWENLYRWRKNGDHILLYTTSSSYHIIPTRLAEQGLDIDKVIEQLIEKVGQPS